MDNEKIERFSDQQHARYKLDKARRDLKNRDCYACMKEVGEIYKLFRKASASACIDALRLIAELIPSCANDRKT